MDLLLTIALPALLAGAVAILVTLAIERFGGVVGGFLGTLPTTVVPASIGLWASADPEVFRDALCAVPPGMFLNAGFLWLWRVLPSRLPTTSLASRLGLMVALTLSAWAVAAFTTVTATTALLGLGVSAPLQGTVATLAILVIGVAACLDGVPAPKGKNRVGPTALVSRGVLAAAAIAIAIAIAKLGSGSLAGMASVFPAIFLTTMVSLWWSQGNTVSSGAVGPMMLGSASVAVYALGATLTFPAWGVGLGVAVPWATAAFGITLPATLWLRHRRATHDARSPL